MDEETIKRAAYQAAADAERERIANWLFARADLMDTMSDTRKKLGDRTGAKDSRIEARVLFNHANIVAGNYMRAEGWAKGERGEP